MSIRLLVSVMVLMGFLGSAQAFEVYVNGQPYRGTVKSRAIQGATLQFDAQGNLFVNAPELVSKTTIKKEPAPSGPGVFLVINNLKTDQYMVKASVNGVKAIVVRSKQKQGVINVEHLLQPGKNTIDLVYYPDPDADATVKGDAVEVMIGRGVESKDGLVIKQIYGKQTHAAGTKGAEMKSISFDVPKSE